MTGVIGHIANPDRSQAIALAEASEAAGARWIGLADAFWWRDVWMLLEGVARQTTTIEIGPAMTNPYLRHPFHTASALATLQEVAPGRVFCGIAAGGSEVTAAAAISRAEAGTRTAELAQLLRDVADGRPLDEDSGRTLDIAVSRVPILMAGRGDAMLEAAGSMADRVLLWAMPASDLERSVGRIATAATRAERAPQLIWAPLVHHHDVADSSLGHIAVYAALNTAPAIRRAWGLDLGVIDAIRSALVAGRLAAAIDLVPAAAMGDLVMEADDTAEIARRARLLGVTEIAVPGFSAESVGGHLAWAAAIEAEL